MQATRDKLATVQVAATVAAGTAALVVLGLQPLLYAAYFIEGVIPEERLGLLGAAEIIAIAIFSAVSVQLARRLPSQVIACAGVALLSVGNFLGSGGQEIVLFLERFLAGSGGGLLVGLAAVAIAQTSRVGAWAGAFLCAQAASQYSVMTWFATYQPNAVSSQLQFALAIIAIAALGVLPLLPRRLAIALPEEPAAAAPSPRGLIGLAAMFLCVGGAGGVWAYLQVWLQSQGVPQADAAGLLSLSLLGQIIGAFLGGLIADGRWNWLRLLILLSGQLLVILLWPLAPHSIWLAIGFGLTFMLAAPCLSGVLVRLDPGRGSIPFLATAQLAGVAIVPTMAGEIFAASNLTLVIIACAVSTLLAGLLVASQAPHLLHQMRKPAL